MAGDAFAGSAGEGGWVWDGVKGEWKPKRLRFLAGLAKRDGLVDGCSEGVSGAGEWFASGLRAGGEGGREMDRWEG